MSHEEVKYAVANIKPRTTHSIRVEINDTMKLLDVNAKKIDINLFPIVINKSTNVLSIKQTIKLTSKHIGTSTSSLDITANQRTKDTIADVQEYLDDETNVDEKRKCNLVSGVLLDENKDISELISNKTDDYNNELADATLDFDNISDCSDLDDWNV